MACRIEDYALIGDLETAALVGRDGSVDWLCWPRFDSAACFAALLGEPRHGRWLVAPCDTDFRTTRSYRDETLILETQFVTPAGTVVVVDLMPPRGQTSNLVRLVTGVHGTVRMRTELMIRFGYGAATPWVTREGSGLWRAIAGPDSVTLRTAVALRGQQNMHVGEFDVQAGETVSFVLSYSPSHLPISAVQEADRMLATTERFWRDWVAKGKQTAHWPPAVTRSLITLRALIYEPTGGIVAAPTASLPEQLGGSRNWDYRFCWLRDATFTLLAFMNAGYYKEAEAWRLWLLRAIAGSPDQLQIMYGIAGERRLTEWEIPWLPGYESSTPVRIGNGAHGQLQLDVFGEVMDALHQARAGGLSTLDAGWAMQRALLAYLATCWEQPDYGIWEVRGPPQHFTYSKIMCWVAFDRAIKDAERYRLAGPLDLWREQRAAIHRQVCERGFDPQRNCFVQAYGSAQLDASLLLIPELGFLPANDPRVDATIREIEANLTRDGLLLRYDTAATDDGLPPGEGAFLACSFWLADAYAMCGRLDDARALFQRLLSLCNDVGLLAEQYDPAARRMTGNFPQGFSHLSLVNTAFNLAQAEKPAEQRSGTSIRP